LVSGSHPLSPTEAKALRDSFPPEALISASQEMLSFDDERYREYLTGRLYDTLQHRAGKLWPVIMKCLMARVPGNALKSEWKSFLHFVSTARPTALDLAAVLLKSVEKGKAPNAVLSFNAEPLLFALLNACAAVNFHKGKVPSHADEAENGPGVADRIEGSTSWVKKGRIPYYFCHGFLPMLDPIALTVCGTPPAALFDSKMVFSERDYLNLANTVWSWQSSVFTRTAMSDRIVFIGLSLTDPNMRRWLAWIHEQRLREIKSRKPMIRESTQHYWINVSSGSGPIDRWTEALVAHLGVRLVWLSAWKEVKPTLQGMLRLS
jgi:hypothetical protein